MIVTDFPDLPYEYTYDSVSKSFKKALEETNGSFTKALFKILRLKAFLMVVLFLLGAALNFCGPLLMKKLMSFFSDENDDIWEGAKYGAILFLTIMISNILINQGQRLAILNFIKTVLACYSLIYPKILKIPKSSLGQIGNGVILNLALMDSNSLALVVLYSSFMVAVPFTLLGGIIWIFYEMGWTAIFGVILLFLNSFLQNIFFARFMAIYTKTVILGDKRSKAIVNMIEGIKTIKALGYEDVIKSNLQKDREEEVKFLRSSVLLSGVGRLISELLPALWFLCVFCLYVYVGGNELTPGKAFTVMSLFGICFKPLDEGIKAITFYSKSKVSNKRIGGFLSALQLIPQSSKDLPIGQLIIKNADFSFISDDVKTNIANIKKALSVLSRAPEQPATPVLKQISLSVNPGELVGVVGKTGSGKTTLLEAIAGELIPSSSDAIQVAGTKAYATQAPWIFNGSLKDNISLFNDANQELYEQILKLCELELDLKAFPQTDNTIVGDRGFALSGGQKQRVALARALYANADIYLIDDSLSAVDAVVSDSIFTNVFLDHLKNKTRLIATHSTHLFPKFQKLVMMKAGQIAATGTYEELLQNEDFKQLIQEEQQKKQVPAQPPKPAPQHVEEKTAEEETEEKKLLFQIDKLRIQAWKDREFEGSFPKEPIGTKKQNLYFELMKFGGVMLGIFTLATFLISAGLQNLINWWIGIWSGKQYGDDTPFYLEIFGAMTFLLGIFLLLQAFCFANFNSASAHNTQMRLISSLLSAKLPWFSKNPMGGIVAKAVTDQKMIDSGLSLHLAQTLLLICNCIGSLILIGAITPPFLAAALLTIIYFGEIFTASVCAKRDTRRLLRTSYEPFINRFVEAGVGANSIRAYGKEDIMEKKMGEAANKGCQVFYFDNYLSNQIELRVSILSALSLGAALLFAFYYKSSIAPAIGGLIIVRSLYLGNNVGSLIRKLLDLESAMTSVERISELIYDIPQEKSFQTPIPPKNWPQNGKIQLNKLSIRYQPQDNNVIHQISMDIEPLQKIGICGRTGAGKTSLSLALLRLVEPHPKSQILIDDVDITKIGLHHLRHKIILVPQDPVLMGTTLKENIDPFGEFSISEVFDALLQIQLVEKIVTKLSNFIIPENEEFTIHQKKEIVNFTLAAQATNFSEGERQLMCLARALIQKPRILIMDEATSSIDEKTDSLIQKILMKDLKSSTIITIAHRIKSIVHYDKIGVLHEGFLLDYDSPLNLIQKKTGIFYMMVKKYGEDYLSQLLAQLN